MMDYWSFLPLCGVCCQEKKVMNIELPLKKKRQPLIEFRIADQGATFLDQGVSNIKDEGSWWCKIKGVIKYDDKLKIEDKDGASARRCIL